MYINSFKLKCPQSQKCISLPRDSKANNPLTANYSRQLWLLVRSTYFPHWLTAHGRNAKIGFRNPLDLKEERCKTNLFTHSPKQQSHHQSSGMVNETRSRPYQVTWSVTRRVRTIAGDSNNALNFLLTEKDYKQIYQAPALNFIKIIA